MKGLLALVLGSVSLTNLVLLGLSTSQAQALDNSFEHSLRASSVSAQQNLYAQANPYQFAVVVNDTDSVVSYEVDGQTFQLAKGEQRSHPIVSYISPRLKYDLFNSADQKNIQTTNLIPGMYYTFKPTFSGQIGLFR